MEISRGVRGLVVGILFIAAFIVPIIFFIDLPSDDRGIELRLSYIHEIKTETGVSNETIALTFPVCLSNISEVLSGVSVGGYPLWFNVSSWQVGDPVNIGEHSGMVRLPVEVFGYFCKHVEIDSETDVYYSREWGLLIQGRWSGLHYYSPYSWLEIDEYYIDSENLLDFRAIYGFTDALLGGGIIVQLAVLIIILEYRRSRTV